MKIGLTIGGFDSTNSAGITNDIKVFHAHGIYAISIITVITIQNSQCIKNIIRLNPDVIKDQVEHIINDVIPDVIKISVIGLPENAYVIGKFIRELGKPCVFDPIFKASDGTILNDLNTLEVVKKEIIPYSTIITPNILEASLLSEIDIKNINDVKNAAIRISKEFGVENVLIKGGHLNTSECIDVLYSRGVFYEFKMPKLNIDVHGTGCTFSTSIASYLAKGYDIVNAVKKAKEFTFNAIKYSLKIGKGKNFVNSLHNLEIESEKYRMIEEMKYALKILEDNSELIIDFIPQVQSNFVYALPKPYVESTKDVLGIPGRIVKVFNKVKPVSEPKFGASDHLARAVLTIMKYNPEIRSCMNIKYNPKIIEVAKELGFTISYFDRREEPEEIKKINGMTIPWGISKAIERIGKVPDIIYDFGDIGKEPMIRIFGKNPIDVIEKLLKIAKKYRGYMKK